MELIKWQIKSRPGQITLQAKDKEPISDCQSHKRAERRYLNLVRAQVRAIIFS